MIAVTFELRPGCKDRYLDLTRVLATELARIPGHLSTEQFESTAIPGKYLSLAFFSDRDAITQWRNLWGHRAAEAHARTGALGEYRLRMAWVSQDYGTPQPTSALTRGRSECGMMKRADGL